MSSPAPAHAPSSPFTPRSRRLSNPPASNHATPIFSRQSPFPRHSFSSSTPYKHSAPPPSNPTDEFGLDDDNDDDLISTVGGGVYIDEDIDMDKEGDSDEEINVTGPGDVTGFSELDADMSIFANLKNNNDSSKAGDVQGQVAEAEVIPSSSQLSGGGVSVSGGIIEEDNEDNDTGTEILERETGMSPVQAFATVSHGEAQVSSPGSARPQTPTRSSLAGSPTPRAPSSVAQHGRHSRASSRSSVFSMISPSSPGRHAASSANRHFQDRDQTTQLIDDFTAQFNSVNHPPIQPHTPNHYTLQNHHLHSSRGSLSGLFSPQPSKSRSETAGTPSRRSMAGTPDSNTKFLIDFDIPPPPTPKSIPSVTLREVEKLKSEFLSQLGELRAQISGKEAEVLNLRESLREAENRCGDLREEVETLEQGKADAEEMLANFREQAQAQFEDARREWDEERQVLMKDSEEARERLENQVETVREQFEETERTANEAKEKEASLRRELDAAKQEIEAFKSSTPAPAYTPVDSNTKPPAECAKCATGTSGASKEEVDRIAKELHVLYKQKHETKVAALKKSYEQRWEKKVKALENEIQNLKASPQGQSTVPENSAPSAETEARIEGLVHEVDKLKKDNDKLSSEAETLKGEVQRERREKGELVRAVEEMLALQTQTFNEAQKAAEEEQQQEPPTTTTTQKPISRPQQSLAAPSKTSGLARPGTLKVKDVKKLEKGWEGVRRRASGIGITPVGENDKTGGIGGIAPPRNGGSGLAQPRAGPASALRRGIEGMGRGAGQN